MRYRVQNDVYHVYTVDEHLLRTVRELHLIEAGEVNGEEPLKSAGELIGPEERRILYLAGLLHDIGKGRGKNHSIRGAIMAEEIAERMGLNDVAEKSAPFFDRTSPYSCRNSAQAGFDGRKAYSAVCGNYQRSPAPAFALYAHCRRQPGDRYTGMEHLESLPAKRAVFQG